MAELEAANAVTTPAVRGAFMQIPRERFVPDALAMRGLDGVYRNDVIVAKTDARGMAISSSSQPTIMALMLEKLELAGGHRVLEIGTGTGYNAALLATLVGPNGNVVSVELDENLARLARSRLRDGGHRARVVVGDGRDGWERGAPFDRIMATASTDEVPRPWFDQLVDGGLIEVPLVLNDLTDSQAVVTFRKVDGQLESTAVVWGGFMALRSQAADGYPALPSISLSCYDGAERTHAAVMGAVIGRLDSSSRRALACLLAEEPRRLPLGQRPHRGSVEVYLATAGEPDLVVCLSGGTRGTGVVTRDGCSLACLAGGKPLGPPNRVHAWGDDRALDRLRGHLARYRTVGSPKIGQLSVTHSYAQRRRPVAGAVPRFEAVLSYQWPPRRVRRTLTA